MQKTIIKMMMTIVHINGMREKEIISKKGMREKEIKITR